MKSQTTNPNASLLKDKTKRIYNLLSPIIDELMEDYVIQDILNTVNGNVSEFFRNKDINNESFRKTLKKWVGSRVKKYLQELFPVPTFEDINSLIQNQLTIIFNNYNNNLSNLMDNVYDRIIQENYPDKWKFPPKLDQLKQYIFMGILNPVIEYKLTLKNRQDRDKIFGKTIENLRIPQQYLEIAFRRYQTKWEQQINENSRPHVRRPRTQNVKEYITFYIVDLETEPRPKSIEEIDDLTYDKRKGNETLESVYQYYLQHRQRKFSQQQIHEIPKQDLNEFIQQIGYKSKDKIKHLIQKNYGIEYHNSWLPDFTPNYFPLKENKKNYGLHIVAPPNSFMIDLMFENGQYVYLVAINMNTRKLWVESTEFQIEQNENEELVKQRLKSTENVMFALNKMIQRGMKVKYIKGDGEGAFHSNLMQEYFHRNDIQFFDVRRQITKYPIYMQDLNMVQSIKSEAEHTSVSLIDRVIRTIRDLAYNMNIGLITPKIMNRIETIYNDAPHSTLSKYAGQPVSPNDVDNDPQLEAFITRKIRQENYNISSQLGFNLVNGQEVSVFNERNNMAKRRSQIEPGTFRIKQRIGNIYEIIDENGNTQLKTRAKINPLFG